MQVVSKTNVSNTKSLRSSCRPRRSKPEWSWIVERSSVLDSIRDGEVAAFENTAIEQVEIDLPLHFVKKRDAGAEQHRMNVEDDFIDQIHFSWSLPFLLYRGFAPLGARCL